MGIEKNFRTLISNLAISNRSEISNRYKQITKRLNSEYWDFDDDSAFSRYVGSYGRGTAIGGFSDLDMIFQLPSAVKSRFDRHSGNGQSALLQEVKDKIKKTYSNTDVGGDGQVVAVKFSDGMTFEVVPAFKNEDESFTYPDTNLGGSWKKTDPIPEKNAVSRRETQTSGDMKSMCKMARAWKRNCFVPIGGLLIDTLAYNFLDTWAHKGNGPFYYDFMTRDFFKYLSSQDPNKSYWYALGSNQHVMRAGNFEPKAKAAYNAALKAIEYEEQNYKTLPNEKWREIYGSKFPQ